MVRHSALHGVAGKCITRRNNRGHGSIFDKQIVHTRLQVSLQIIVGDFNINLDVEYKDFNTALNSWVESDGRSATETEHLTVSPERPLFSDS